MSDEFEKTTKTILGNDESSYSKVVLNLAIGIDRVMTDMKLDAELRHSQTLKAISEMKTAVDKDCTLCRNDVKKNFNLLKPILSLADNPKLFKFILFLFGLVLIMAFRGGHDYFSDLSKLITSIK